MNKKKFRIKYKVLFTDGDSFENKEILISNCQGGVHAQVRLEDYLKRKYINFKQLIVSECKEENNFDDLMSQFGDLFAGGNLFGGKN